MKRVDAQRAAALLAEAWQMGQWLPALPEACRPRTIADGYQVQRLMVEAIGIAPAGWKVGCTSPATRKALGARAPFAGRVFATRVFESGARLTGAAYPMRGIEAEFAFRLGADLPPRARAYTRADVAKAVAAVHPAIEIVSPRFVDLKAVNLASLVADLGVSAALVLGRPIPRWRQVNLPAQAVRMVVNGKAVAQGTGAEVLGHPLESLAWLANLLRRRGGLKAGEIVTTGSCTGLVRAEPGAAIRAEFGRLGQVEASFVG